jgi:hypothetical protein
MARSCGGATAEGCCAAGPGLDLDTKEARQPSIAVKVEITARKRNSRPEARCSYSFVLGAGLALFGVWLTNRNNAATNAADRRHALDLERVERIQDKVAAEAKSRTVLPRPNRRYKPLSHSNG